MECLLEDRGTCLAVEQYISGAGKLTNSEGLAQAVADYCKSLEDSESPVPVGRELVPWTAIEWFRRMRCHWVDLKKGVYSGGHERADDTLLPSPWVIQLTTHTQEIYPSTYRA